MPIDWTQLAVDVGSVGEDGIESGGTAFAQHALERVIGEDSLRAAVELVLAHGRGTELAMNVLRHLCSRRAAELAYEAYRAETGARAAAAVWLIKHIAHPIAVTWIAEFLDDHNVAGLGVDALDQLAWSERVEAGDVEHLVAKAENHPLEHVREKAAFIRQVLAGRVQGRG